MKYFTIYDKFSEDFLKNWATGGLNSKPLFKDLHEVVDSIEEVIDAYSSIDIGHITKDDFVVSMIII